MNTVKVKEMVLGPGRPKVVVPIVGTTPEEIIAECKAAREELPCDMIEWRADYYLSAMENLDEKLKDMNRAFPGNPEGLITSRVTYFYFENFIKEADFNLSFHGGGNGLYLEPLVTRLEPGTELGEITERLAMASGLKVVWEMNKNLPFDGTLIVEAKKVGVPSVTIELGGQGVRVDHRDEMIELSVKAMKNMMIEFDMLEGVVERAPEDEIKQVEIKYVHTDEGGYHKLKVKPMDFVKGGTICSEIVDIFGNKVGEVVAPFDCYIVGYWSYSTIHPGNWAFLFGKPI